MAFRSFSCHPHPASSSSMASAGPRFGTRKRAAALSFRTRAAHGCNPSSSRLPFAAETSNKVFEDQVRGIVCYRDDKGDMVCEGYDEGPRLGMRLPEKACFPWSPISSTWQRSGFSKTVPPTTFFSPRMIRSGSSELNQGGTDQIIRAITGSREMV